ncbi:MAG: VOC family protein [Congregibacter sp.]|nr:VOC family protein [Congregibacter sp.]MDP5069588.1 VOC family protein [Congregibacter sp.]
MIGYVVLGTNHLERAAAFYDALFNEIGATRQMDFGERGFAWGASVDSVMLCVMKPFDGKPATIGNGTMTALGVASHEEVNLIHAKALELGGTDEGPPGLRSEGGDGFYAAYFRDLDGHKLDVFTYS